MHCLSRLGLGDLLLVELPKQLNVLGNQAVNAVDELAGGGPLAVVGIEAVLEELLDDGVPIVSVIVLAKVLLVAVEPALANILLDLKRILAIKRVPLGDQVVEAAAEGPDVHFRIQEVIGAVLQDFRRRIIKMATKALILQQLLEVVRHANEI